MRRIAGLAILTCLLAGCVSPEQQARADRAQCLKYGFTEGSDGFANCMMTTSANRDAQMHQDVAEQNAQYQQQQWLSELRYMTEKQERQARERREEKRDGVVDQTPHFDQSGNPTYDTQGNYNGCHGTGCLVDPPDE